MNFNITRELIRQILDNAHSYPWTLQGFGMLRLKLGKVARVHIWNPLLAKPGVSTIHSHPWDLKSTIIAGRLLNVRYTADTGGAEEYDTHFGSELQTGEGGGLLGDPYLCRLAPRELGEWYRPGDSYSQKKDEIHETIADHGTVTLLERWLGPPDEEALTFWPRARGLAGWVSAEPRVASGPEIEASVAMALANFGD